LYAQVVRLSVFKLVNTIFSKRMLFGTQLAHGKGHGTINFEGHEVKGITRCQRFLGEGIILDLFGRVSFIDYSTQSTLTILVILMLTSSSAIV